MPAIVLFLVSLLIRAIAPPSRHIRMLVRLRGSYFWCALQFVRLFLLLLLSVSLYDFIDILYHFDRHGSYVSCGLLKRLWFYIFSVCSAISTNKCLPAVLDRLYFTFYVFLLFFCFATLHYSISNGLCSGEKNQRISLIVRSLCQLSLICTHHIKRISYSEG